MDNKKIEELKEITTIIKIEDNKSREFIFGEEFYVSRFSFNQGEQVDLTDLDEKWQNKWDVLGKEWNPEIQNYRFLYNSFKLFYYSFNQLRFHKVSSSECCCIDKKVHNELAGVNLFGMYYHGAKCIKLLYKLKLVNLKNSPSSFHNKFIETRNKLIEHNYNPTGFKFQIEPNIWSLGTTDSLLEVYIHDTDAERFFDVFVDYYEDYYNLEEVITNVIKTF